MEHPHLEPAEDLAEGATTLTLDQQRDLVLRLAPRVLAQLSDEEQQQFLQELEENLTLARATAPHEEGGGNANPGAWELPNGQ